MRQLNKKIKCVSTLSNGDVGERIQIAPVTVTKHGISVKHVQTGDQISKTIAKSLYQALLDRGRSERTLQHSIDLGRLPWFENNWLLKLGDVIL